MITVTFNNIEYRNELRFADTESGVIGLTVEGHALPVDTAEWDSSCVTAGLQKGENIICAAVSFATMNLLRSVAMIAGIRPEYDNEDGLFRLTIVMKGLDEVRTAIVRVLVESFMIGMLDLEKAHPGFIEINTVMEKS